MVLGGLDQLHSILRSKHQANAKSGTRFCQRDQIQKATITQLRYIYNNVIIPKLEYLHQITKLNESQCHKIERKAIQCLKHLFGLSTTTNDNIVFSETLFDVKRLWDN